jgi:Ni/Co efflux regulator RcnB
MKRVLMYVTAVALAVAWIGSAEAETGRGKSPRNGAHRTHPKAGNRSGQKNVKRQRHHKHDDWARNRSHERRHSYHPSRNRSWYDSREYRRHRNHWYYGDWYPSYSSFDYSALEPWSGPTMFSAASAAVYRSGPEDEEDCEME